MFRGPAAVHVVSAVPIGHWGSGVSNSHMALLEKCTRGYRTMLRCRMLRITYSVIIPQHSLHTTWCPSPSLFRETIGGESPGHLSQRHQRSAARLLTKIPTQLALRNRHDHRFTASWRDIFKQSHFIQFLVRSRCPGTQEPCHSHRL